MIEISTEVIKQAIYNLCLKANTCLDERVYTKILKAYNNTENSEIKSVLKSILQNAKIAYEKQKPLCQDTGQVIVFLDIGQNVLLTGDFIENAVNKAVEECYKDNFFRKSVVKNALFDRNNTKTNTPAIIYTKYIDGDFINIKILIKGAGSENKSKLEMMLPTSEIDEFVEKCSELILSAGENSCPPMFVGIGVGGTSEKACILSKEALVEEEFAKEEIILSEKIKNLVNKNAPKKYLGNYILDIKLKTISTHIACLPVAITINCHSDRVSSCKITERGIIYNHQVSDFIELPEDNIIIKEISSDNIEDLRKLKQDEEFLLTGEIYVARDMAHKKLVELISRNEKLPFDIKDKIIFYAGPCPNKDGEVIGSIGPTTASRMDKYAELLYNKGLFASIGKGSRSEELINIIKNNNARYFTVTGGIAALLSEKVKSSEIIAFEELGPESLYKLYVEKLPLKMSL